MLFFLIILFLILLFYIFLSRRLVNGMLAGFFTGIINFFIISFLVKKIFAIINEIAATKIIKMLLVYIIKILFFSFVIFLVIINREFLSILGFLIGFTLTVVVIFLESLMLKRT